jgi:UDP:flavonoid glycosyltransferase YjiC (YdhE family)
MIRDDLALIKTFKPDFIIGDFRLSLLISARVAKVPFANITNRYWAPEVMTEWHAPESFMTHRLGVPLCNWMLRSFPEFLLSSHVAAFKKAAQQWKVPLSEGITLNELYHQGDYQLYCDIPAFIEETLLAPSQKVIGPVIWNPEGALPSWWNQIPKDQPIIYLNLGSSGQPATIPKLLEWLLPLEYTLLVAGHGDTPLPVHPRIFQAPFLPGSRASALANLVMCNGGSPSTQQALAEGTPILGVCSNLDQILNMKLIHAHGVGLACRSDYLRKESFLEAVHTLMTDESYQQNAIVLAEKMKPQESAGNFLDVLEKWLGQASGAKPRVLSFTK